MRCTRNAVYPHGYRGSNPSLLRKANKIGIMRILYISPENTVGTLSLWKKDTSDVVTIVEL